MLAVDLIRRETHVILPNSCASNADPPLAASGRAAKWRSRGTKNAECIESQPALRKFTKPLFCRRFGLFLEIW
jgi:hypothetical protein